jgi:hypothetical protein
MTRYYVNKGSKAVALGVTFSIALLTNYCFANEALDQQLEAIEFDQALLKESTIGYENFGFYRVDRYEEKTSVSDSDDKKPIKSIGFTTPIGEYSSFSLSENMLDNENKAPFDGWTFKQNRKFPLLYKEKNNEKVATIPMIVPGVQRGDFFELSTLVDTQDAETLVFSYSASESGGVFINALKGCGIYLNTSVMAAEQSLLSQNHCISKGKYDKGVSKMYVMDVSTQAAVNISARFEIGRFQFTEASQGDINLWDLNYWLIDKNSAAKSELVGNSIPLLLKNHKDEKVFGVVTLNNVNTATLHLNETNEHGAAMNESFIWAYNAHTHTLLFKNDRRHFAFTDLKLKAVSELSQRIEAATWYSTEDEWKNIEVAEFVGFNAKNHQYSVFVGDGLLLEMNFPERVSVNGEEADVVVSSNENAEVLTLTQGQSSYHLSHIIQISKDKFAALVIGQSKSEELMHLLDEVNM